MPLYHFHAQMYKIANFDVDVYYFAFLYMKINSFLYCKMRCIYILSILDVLAFFFDTETLYHHYEQCVYFLNARLIKPVKIYAQVLLDKTLFCHTIWH